MPDDNGCATLRHVVLRHAAASPTEANLLRHIDQDGSTTVDKAKCGMLGAKAFVLFLCVGLARQALGVRILHRQPALHRRHALARGQ